MWTHSDLLGGGETSSVSRTALTGSTRSEFRQRPPQQILCLLVLRRLSTDIRGHMLSQPETHQVLLHEASLQIPNGEHVPVELLYTWSGWSCGIHKSWGNSCQSTSVWSLDWETWTSRVRRKQILRVHEDDKVHECIRRSQWCVRNAQMISKVLMKKNKWRTT